jgi:metal-responsive CopG/Arc/MetJ family transcriptional regulator
LHRVVEKMSRKHAKEERRQRHGPTTLISIHVPAELVRGIDRLVEMGVFLSRSEAFRIAAYELIAKYRFLWEDKGKPQVGYR